MRVLITGIDGFVGSHTAEFLLQQANVEVHGTVFGDIPRPNIAAIESSLHLHPIDLMDSAQVASVVRAVRPDRIIHLAGQAFGTPPTPRGFMADVQHGYITIERQDFG